MRLLPRHRGGVRLDEASILRALAKIPFIIGPFLKRHAQNLLKRVGYNYFLRDFHSASLEILFETVFLLFGLIFGLIKWYHSSLTGVPVTAGTVMLSALPVLMGFQMILSFLQFDIQAVPRDPLIVTEMDVAAFNPWPYSIMASGMLSSVPAPTASD